MKKNKKSSFILLVLLALLAITMLMATACSRKQETADEQAEVPTVEEFTIEIGENEAVGGF